MTAVTRTEFDFKGQTAKYIGKVRDVYTIDDKYLVMVATDRISAFDVILPKGIPYKGQVLNQIASGFLDLTEDIVPNWKIASPDPMVTVGYKCEGLPVEILPHHQRFPAVPVEGHLRHFHRFQIRADHGTEHLLRHPGLPAAVEFRLVQVIAIITAQIAERPGRLDHQVKRQRP